MYIYVCAHASQQSDTDTKRSPYQRTNHRTTQVAPRRRARGRALGAGPPGAGAAAGGLHQGVCRVMCICACVCAWIESSRAHQIKSISTSTTSPPPPKKHLTAVPGVSGAVPRGAGQAAADTQGQAVRLPRAPHLRPLRGPSSLGVFVCVCRFVCADAMYVYMCVYTFIIAAARRDPPVTFTPYNAIPQTFKCPAVRGTGAEAHRALHDAGPVPRALAEQAGGHGGRHRAVPRHRQGAVFFFK